VAFLRRLDRSFQGFFKRVKAGQKPGYPRFKGRGWWDSIEWPEGNGARWDSTVRTITTKRECGRWYVMQSCDDVPAGPLEPTGSALGIDMGVASFLTTAAKAGLNKSVTPPNDAPSAATAQRGTASPRRTSAVSAAATRPTPMSTPP
jgi:putative transposase